MNKLSIMKLFKFTFLLIASISFSQAPSIDWQKTFGGSDEDYGFCITSDFN